MPNLNTKMWLFCTILFLLKTTEAGPKKCKGEDKNTYAIGKGYTEGCTLYICKKIGRKLKMAKQLSPNCCQHKEKFYQPGEEIESTALAECSQKVIKCTLTSRGSEAHTMVVHGNCCNFNGEVLQVGERVALPKKCEWAVCRQVMNQTSQELVPTLQMDVAHDSCHCCLGEDGDLYKEGQTVKMISGAKGVCCGGHWADAINVTSTQSFDLVVTGGNNFGPCFDNSSLVQKESVCKPVIPDFPHDINGAQSVWFDNMLWACGGKKDGHRSECYTYTTGMQTWQLNSNMTKGRYGFGLTMVSDDIMLATGGTFRGHEITNTMDIYKKGRGTWEQTSFNMTYPRYRHWALTYNTFVVVISGLIGTSNEPHSTAHAATDSVEQLDMSTGTWTQLTPIPKALTEHACALMEEEGESVMYVSGGQRTDDRPAVYKYKQNKWVVAGYLNRPRHGHTMNVGRGNLDVAGGAHYYGGPYPNGTQHYYTSIETMSQEGDWTEWENGLDVARYAHSMAKVPLRTFPCKLY